MFGPMLGSVVAGLILSGCSFNGASKQSDGGVLIDAATIDAPVSPKVRFTSIELVGTNQLHPGQYGIEVKVELVNELSTTITDLQVQLVFDSSGTSQPPSFRWRSFDHRENTPPMATTIAPGKTTQLRFLLDVPASAATSEIVKINGAATFWAEGDTLAATPLETPLTKDWMSIREIVVDTANDDTADPTTSLRKAISQAMATNGLSRITFAPLVFPPDKSTTITLESALGELPKIDKKKSDLVIDGTGVELSVDLAWKDSENYGLRIDGPTVVVSGMSFRNFARGYPETDLTSDNCGSQGKKDGGAIKVESGTLILDGNHFADPDVAERDCYGAVVRVQGGNGHLILNNQFTDQVMDSISFEKPFKEVSGNVFVGKKAPGATDPVLSDDGVVVNFNKKGEYWITSNLFVDLEFSGILVGDTVTRDVTLNVIHDTFIRNGNALLQKSDAGAFFLRNNAYLGNQTQLLLTMGSAIDIDFESVDASMLCECSQATLGSMNVYNQTQQRFTNPSGSTIQDFTPLSNSSLIDNGTDLLDRNGRMLGRYINDGPDRGAVERNHSSSR